MIRIDAKSLSQLNRALEDIKAGLGEKVMHQSFGDGIRRAQTVARRETIREGGFNRARPSLSAKVRKSIRGYTTSPMSAEIKGSGRFERLTHWAKPRDPLANYRGHGVSIHGAFGRDYRIFENQSAFVRSGTSGIAVVLGRQGAGRYPLKTFSGPSVGTVMRAKSVIEPTRERFFNAVRDGLGKRFDRHTNSAFRARGL
ncbi:hypothetical protein [Oricola indica]|uniref:hypothetical protein n=1 Tax=Oricola indica TaxID=2872591 RepID=UPI001CC008DF|nr:hypothetical protein [Oricola indica]